MRIAVPDLISNSYFPAVAAAELGFFESEGLEAELQLIFPVTRTMEALRDDALDFVAGPAHATLTAFPEWRGAKLVAALAQKTYWLLILRSKKWSCPAYRCRSTGTPACSSFSKNRMVSWWCTRVSAVP